MSRNPSSALSLLSVVAGRAFLPVTAIGRLPAAMIQLGLLLIATQAVGDITLGGTLVAAVGIGTACGAPVLGRLVDRFGPLRIIVGALAIQLVALSGIYVALSGIGGRAFLIGSAAVVGMSNPQIGSVSRSIWSALIHTRAEQGNRVRSIRVAMGAETAMDELAFVVGPMAAGVISTSLGAHQAVIFLVAFTVIAEGIFITWLFLHRGVLARAEASQEDPAVREVRQKPTVDWARLVPIFVTIIAIGAVFGSTQTALTAINSSRGLEYLTGWIYGSMGITSAVAGLIAPGLGGSAVSKNLRAGLVIAVPMILFMAIPDTWWLLGIVLISGLGVGTALVTSYATLESLAPKGRVASIMTIGATCIVVGVSLGSLTTGALAGTLSLAPLPAFIAGLTIIVLALPYSVREFTARK